LVEYQCNNFSPSRPNDKPNRETYIGNGVIYTVSIDSGIVLEADTKGSEWILNIDGRRDLTLPEELTIYTETELEAMARTFIKKHLLGINLNSFTYHKGRKGSNHFFRWENETKVTEGQEKAYVQVGLSDKGQLLNYYDFVSHRD